MWRNSRTRPTSRWHRRAATLSRELAHKPPPDAPPQRQRLLHLGTNKQGSNTTVWQVINLGMNMNNIRFKKTHNKVLELKYLSWLACIFENIKRNWGTKQTSMNTYNIMKSYNPRRAHPFSVIYMMKRASTHDKHDIHNISTTRFPTKTGIPAAEPDTHDV